MTPSLRDFWPRSGYKHLQQNARGWLVPTEAYVRTFLSRPELALVPESCAAEVALHEGLQAAPLKPVAVAELAAL